MDSRYEIKERIGQGGLGSVFKAYDTQLHREVAMKRVLTADQGTPAEVEAAGEKLIAEAQTLSTLNHPNIVTVFDVGQDEDGGFVVMELLKGETLDETVERGVLTTDDFIEVVIQTMEGLIAAQDKNVIHRDIKPTNIMLIWQASGKFQLKILDFGLAKFSRSPSVQTMDQDDAVMGSIFFMAPEQFERTELDARTDLYQMGCVYYNSLTGQYPFNGETAPQVMNAHLQHKVVPLDQLRPDMPPAMAQWVMWLINRDIESRPSTAKEALKYFPKDANTAPALPAEAAIPTATAVPASSVRIATPTAAKAPPNLIVGTTTSQLTTGTGSTTVQLATGSAAPATGATTSALRGDPLRKTAPQKKGPGKATMIVSAVGAAIILSLAAVIFLNKQKQKKNLARLTELAESDSPNGSVKDVALLVRYLADPKTLHERRSQSYNALKEIQGSGVDDAILQELKEAKTSALRKQLSNILSFRGYKPALGAILAMGRVAREEKDKISYLNFARPLATSKDLEVFLQGLEGNSSLNMRKAYENTILSILRRSGNSSSTLSGLRQRIKETKNGERRSLFRVLGAMNGKETARLLDRIFKGNDIKQQQDAITAYIAWPNREPLPKVAELAKSKNKALSIAAQRAYTSLSTRPGPQTVDQEVKDWKAGFALMQKNPSEMRRMLQSCLETPHPKVVAMLDEFKGNERYGGTAAMISDSIKKSLGRMAVIDPSKPLKGNMARVQGDGAAGINSFLEAITMWTSPETFFVWNFKIKDDGEYSITVNQADLNDAPSNFLIYLDGKTFKGKSAKTENLEEFIPVKVEGSIALTKGQVYKLTLVAGEGIQPRMMDIQSIVLTKLQ